MGTDANGNASAGATRRLAEFAASLTYDDLPAAAVALIKQVVLDTVGCSLAATTLGAGCREVVQAMRDLASKPEATILGSSHKVAAADAAFANGALAHALNYDAFGPEVGHVGVVCLAAPLAMAEAAGGVSGRRFLAAAAVAAEVSCRLTLAITRTGRRPSEKFLAGQLLSYFGCAAGAGNIQGLNADEMLSALGLALMQASGSMQMVIDGDQPAKAVYGAFPNHGGVRAALLSAAGLGAQCDALEGDAGLYAMVYGGEYDHGALTDGLGTEFALMATGFKPWPTSIEVHPYIEAARRMAADGLDIAGIGEVRIIGHGSIRPWCEPVAERRRPQNAASAANSIPFGVAKALCNGDVTLADFTDEGLADEAALAIAGRCVYQAEDGMAGGTLHITTRDGATREVHVSSPPGVPSRPLPRDRLLAKFHDCCRYAASPLRTSQVEALVGLIENLEDVPDIGVLARMAAGGA